MRIFYIVKNKHTYLLRRKKQAYTPSNEFNLFNILFQEFFKFYKR